jgi:phosphatidylglycerophosphatase A
VGEKDPQIIVVDEVAGQWLALSAAPLDPLYYGLGFVLFRAADIWKIWPASWVDRSLSGSLGVMLDDAISGIYAAIAVFVVVVILG